MGYEPDFLHILTDVSLFVGMSLLAQGLCQKVNFIPREKIAKGIP